METIEYFNVLDKKSWPRGEWGVEPDKRQWQDEATGLPCLIVRNVLGGLCGYVGVTQEHPLFQLDENDLHVHGGVTFASFCQENGPIEHRICHIPAPGETDRVWWFGFDCAHSGDFVPAYHSALVGEYRNIAYVTAECTSLAKQLKALAL